MMNSGYKYGIPFPHDRIKIPTDLVEMNEQRDTDPIPRMTWAETWMSIAKTIADMRSYDPRLKVGAIVVSEDNTQMLALGYNGNAKGLPNVPESLEPGKSGFVHAEANCLIKCDYHYAQRKIMYVTHSPCQMCAKMIINGNIFRVIYDDVYRDMSGADLLKSAGIQVYSLDEAILIERHEQATR
jgi:dCMP deaminase